MLERRYRRTGTDADRLAWIKQLKTMYAVYEEKGHQHWLTKIADSGGNTKKLWHTMHGILGENQSGRRDDSDCSAEDFAKFFADKFNLHDPSHHLKISPIQRATSSTSGSL